MAIPVEQVHGTGITTYEENNEWRFGEQSGGVVSVTLVPELFNVDDEALKNKYLTGLGPNATVIYIRSGIPLALITSGENTGAYGPYDPTATDGRQTKIAGLLESMIQVNITYSGWDVDDVYVGMRYRGDIIKSKLPVVPADDVLWDGDFYDIEDDKVTPLSTTKGAAATGTPSTVTAANITDASATGRSVLTAKDAAAARTAIGAGTSSFSGSYNDLTNKPTIPAAYTLPAATASAIGGVKQAAGVNDLAAGADATAIVTAVNQLFANLRAAGTLAPKA